MTQPQGTFPWPPGDDPIFRAANDLLPNAPIDFPAVKAERIAALLDDAPTQEHTFWGKCLIVAWQLPSGFVVSGRGECQHPEGFDLEIGRTMARQDAEAKLWEHEVYLARWLEATLA